MNTSHLELQSRDEKAFFLTQVIEKLEIQKEEKSLYLFSMEILDDSDFEVFFKKIVNQIPQKIIVN